MIRSMTGYGRGEAEDGAFRVTVGIRCTNHRFADLKLRLPGAYATWEADLRRAILGRVRRGRVEVDLAVEEARTSAAALELDRPLLEGVLRASRALREEFGLGGELDQGTVLRLPGILGSTPEPEGADAAKRGLALRALEAALEAVDRERLREGEALARDLRGRLERMEELMSGLRGRAAGVPEATREKLLERLRALDPHVELDPARLAQEVLFLAERADVTEELVRLESHLDRAKGLLDGTSDEPVGKRLDFLMQEVHREANTVGSKSADFEMSRSALDLKVETEKVREQAQNLE